MAYMFYQPYKRVQIGMGGTYESGPLDQFRVPFSSQAIPGPKYEQAEISVPAQVSAAPSTNIAPATPTTSTMGGGFMEQQWTVGPYGLGQDPITDLQNGTFLQNYGIYLALGLGAYLLLGKKGRR